MDELKLLESTGFSLPSVAYIAGSIAFGILGYAAYRWGKATSRRGPYWIGIALICGKTVKSFFQLSLREL